MKKRIGDCTFNEFLNYCEARACDGMWHVDTGLVCIKVIDDVLKVKPIFFRSRARNKRWNEIKGKFLNLDAEIEI